MNFLPYALPEIGDEEIAEVVATLRSGWVTTGPRAKLFEQHFTNYLGGDVESIAVNSATAGLHLALEALGVGPGDEVITTTLTFTATTEVVRYLGAHPVLVDVDPVTLNIDVARIRAAITPKTKVIMPMHYAGLACDMDAIHGLAREFNLRVVEDAAHALSTVYRGKLIGTLDSDVTVFSFYANKNMTTGEGGMVVTRNREVADRVRTMRLHGINRDAFDRFVSKTPSWYYEVVAPGFKYNLTDIAAAIGIHQLKKIGRFLERRQALARRYLKELAGLPLIFPVDADAGSVHAWHLFVLRLTDDAKIDRDAVIQGLSDRGIGTSVHYVPLHRHPYWRDTYHLAPEQFPVADKHYLATFSIPLYTLMTDEDQSRVIDALKDILALIGTLLLSPLLLAIAVWVKLDSDGPVFFKQERVGRFGKTFRILKFRTMQAKPRTPGLQITVGADPRITRCGHSLRKYKLDELPQLINVIVGDMSLVGPRPEVPQYVACYPAAIRDLVLSVRPGITDWASVEYRDESTLLANAEDPNRMYIEQVLPAKLGYYVKYVVNRTFADDLKIIFCTLMAVVK